MKPPLHALALVASVVAFLPVVSSDASLLISDDFSTTTIANENRLRIGDASDDWVKNSDSLWAISGGTLNNPGTTAGLAAEGAVLKLFEVGTQPVNFTTLTFSFDYTVGTGSTLYFHAIGLHSGTTLGANTQLHNTGVQNGTIQSQYNNGTTNAGDFTGVNLFTGALNPNGNSGTAIAFASNTSGTFSGTYDISGYSGISSINDLQFLTMGFGSDVTDTSGAGAISLDNFSVTAAVPEPANAFVIALGIAALMTGRRRRMLC